MVSVQCQIMIVDVFQELHVCCYPGRPPTYEIMENVVQMVDRAYVKRNMKTISHL